MKYISFMEDYADFLEELREQEKAKMQALFSTDLKNIEAAMNAHQMAVKKIQSLEEQRITLCRENGFEGKSMSEIANSYENLEEKNRLKLVQIRFERAIKGVSYFNKKSLEIARYQMAAFNPDNASDDKSHYYNSKGETDTKRSGVSILEVKA